MYRPDRIIGTRRAVRAVERTRVMGIPNRDEAEGALERTKGKIKEGVGRAVGNDRLTAEGEVDQAEGQAQQSFGEGRRKIGEAIEDVGERIKR